jgi:opacity protein-like surface antigen
MRRLSVSTLSSMALLGALFLPREANAQGFGINAQAGYFAMSATDSAKAVFGSSGGFMGGGGLSYTFGHLYVEGGARYFSKEGERVFIAQPGDTPFPLGHPLKVRLIPGYGTVGYRFGNGAFLPYVGAGAGVVSYREESTVAGLDAEASETKAEFHGLVGVEYGRGHLRFAAELVYSSAPNAIGIAGVSKVYGEDDLGGLLIQGKIVFNTKTR